MNGIYLGTSKTSLQCVVFMTEYFHVVYYIFFGYDLSYLIADNKV